MSLRHHRRRDQTGPQRNDAGAVTKEFFIQYASLFGELDAALQKLAAKDPVIGREFKTKNVSTGDFAKKLMGQIVFLYFLQIRAGSAWRKDRTGAQTRTISSGGS